MKLTIKGDLMSIKPIHLEQFKGGFSDFYDQYILPQLPIPESVSSIHRLLVECINDESTPLIVRKFNGTWKGQKDVFSKRGVLYTSFKREFICSDNEVALWVYARAVTGDYKERLKSLREVILNQAFPIGFACNKSIGENTEFWSNWKKESWEINCFSKRGWLHAHLNDVNTGFDIKNISIDQLKIRSFRYLHPANHFLIPSFKKFKNNNLDERKDFGAIDSIKQFIASMYAQRYLDIWDEFLQLTQSDFSGTLKIEEVPLSFSRKIKGA
jgi:hypothetical protein